MIRTVALVLALPIALAAGESEGAPENAAADLEAVATEASPPCSCVMR